MDDGEAIVDNPAIRHLLWAPAAGQPQLETAVQRRPVVQLTLAVNYWLGGLDPFGYHAWNLAIHFLCALVLYALVDRTLKRRVPGWERSSGGVAFAVALLWLLHPMQTEVVDYVTQRTESMMALAYLLTLYAASRAMDSRDAGRWTVLAALSCAAGAGCKEAIATAPLMVLAYDVAFVSGRPGAALRARPRLYVGLAGSWIVIALLAWWSPPIRSRGFESGVTAWAYLLNEPALILRYLRLSVWPSALVVDYGLPRAVPLSAAAPGGALILATIAATIWAWWRVPTLAFVGTWFFVTLAPASSFIPVATEVGAERRMYLPMAAVITLAVLTVEWVLSRSVSRKPARRAASVALLATAALILATATVQRNREYRDPLVLWRTVISRYPHGRAYYNLGVEQARLHQTTEALESYRIAAADFPTAHYALGITFASMGRHEEAVAALERFVLGRPLDILVPKAYTVMAREFAAQGQLDKAETTYRMVLQMVPSERDARLDLANLLLRSGRYDNARLEFQEYVSRFPDEAAARIGYGVTLMAGKQSQAAIQQFEHAVLLAPRDPGARENLALALAETGRPELATERFREALQLAPASARLYSGLGLALIESGRDAEGIDAITRARAMDPNDDRVRMDIALARDRLTRNRLARHR